jgi:hypothetical protein
MSTLTSEHAAQLAAPEISAELSAARGYTSIAPGSIHDWRQFRELRQRIGREKAGDLAERFWCAYPLIKRPPVSPQAQQVDGPWR